MGDFGSFRDGFAAPLHRGVRIVLQFAALCMIALPASAAPPAVRENIDKNQVDLFRGSFAADETVMTIGQDQGIAVTQHWRGSGWTGNMWPMIYKSGTTLTVTINGVTDRFIQSGSVTLRPKGEEQALHRRAAPIPIKRGMERLSVFLPILPTRQTTNPMVRRLPVRLSVPMASGWITPIRQQSSANIMRGISAQEGSGKSGVSRQ